MWNRSRPKIATPFAGRVPGWFERGRVFTGAIRVLVLVAAITAGSVAAGAGTPGPGHTGNVTGVSGGPAVVDSVSTAAVDVSIVETTTAVEGESVVVTVAVENTGTQETAQSVVADAGALGTDSTNVTLGAGESTEVQLSIETEITDAAASPYTVTVSTANDADSTAVSVHLPVLDGAEGSPQDLTNDSEYEDVDGDGEFTIFDVQTFFTQFDGPAVQEHTWAYEFGSGGGVTVLDVQGLFSKLQSRDSVPAYLDVRITAVDAEVTVGENVSVAYEVTNTGDFETTGNVTVAVDGAVEQATTVTLDGGETVSDEFTYQTGTDDLPETAVTVASEDDQESATVPIAVEEFDLVASLGEAEGSVGETVGVELSVVSADAEGGDAFGSYELVFSYDESVLQFAGIESGGWGGPTNTNELDGALIVADFAPTGATPADPAMTLLFEVVGNGTSTVSFDDSVTPVDNSINDEDSEAYLVSFEDGAAGTTVNGTADTTRTHTTAVSRAPRAV
jgi:hypothetical protein